MWNDKYSFKMICFLDIFLYMSRKLLYIDSEFTVLNCDTVVGGWNFGHFSVYVLLKHWFLIMHQL